MVSTGGPPIPVISKKILTDTQDPWTNVSENSNDTKEIKISASKLGGLLGMKSFWENPHERLMDIAVKAGWVKNWTSTRVKRETLESSLNHVWDRIAEVHDVITPDIVKKNVEVLVDQKKITKEEGNVLCHPSMIQSRVNKIQGVASERQIVDVEQITENNESILYMPLFDIPVRRKHDHVATVTKNRVAVLNDGKTRVDTKHGHDTKHSSDAKHSSWSEVTKSNDEEKETEKEKEKGNEREKEKKVRWIRVILSGQIDGFKNGIMVEMKRRKKDIGPKQQLPIYDKIQCMAYMKLYDYQEMIVIETGPSFNPYTELTGVAKQEKCDGDSHERKKSSPLARKETVLKFDEAMWDKCMTEIYRLMFCLTSMVFHYQPTLLEIYKDHVSNMVRFSFKNRMIFSLDFFFKYRDGTNVKRFFNKSWKHKKIIWTKMKP